MPKCKTVTYQRFYMIRATRIWNHLVDELNLNTDSLSSFKSVMFKVYMQGKMKNLKFRNLERNDLP
jgi:hypothetical protein